MSMTVQSLLGNGVVAHLELCYLSHTQYKIKRVNDGLKQLQFLQKFTLLYRKYIALKGTKIVAQNRGPYIQYFSSLLCTILRV